MKIHALSCIAIWLNSERLEGFEELASRPLDQQSHDKCSNLKLDRYTEELVFVLVHSIYSSIVVTLHVEVK